MGREINPFGLRMPLPLREALEKSAKEGHRSLNAEIVARLERSLAPAPRVVKAEGKAASDDSKEQRKNLILALEIAEDLLVAEGKDMASKEKAEFVDVILDLLVIDEDPAKVKRHIKNVVNIAPHLKRRKSKAS